MNQKCSGQKADGSQCPKAGSCALAKAWDAQLVIQAPFVMEGNTFTCTAYTVMNEINVGGNDQDLGNYEQLNG